MVVEVTRGTEVESSHLVDAAVVDSDGRVVQAWGDAGRAVLPRSAIKPIQALPLIDTGAADHFDMSEIELALACASHDGEPDHVAALERWLLRIGLTEEALECGSHAPLHEPSATELACLGVDFGPRHNNCSGKHIGFLTVCQHIDLAPSGYILPDHPLQRDHVTPVVEELCLVDLADQTPAIDGCGIPVWSVPLDGLARGWAALPGRPGGLRLLDAMTSVPFYVAGSDRACTRIMRAAAGSIAVKTGAEGVYCGVVPDRGLGIALKVRDGGRRASEAAIEWILEHLGLPSSNGQTEVVNWAGTSVGVVRVNA
jgi:L-asparaginase II